MKRKVLNLLLSVMLCVLCIPAMKVNAAAGTAITIQLNTNGSCQVDHGTGFTCLTNGYYRPSYGYGPLITVDPGYHATIATNGYYDNIGYYVDANKKVIDGISGSNPILINDDFSEDITGQFVVTLESGHITGGEYGQAVWNYGTISGGTFKENIANFGQISYGDFKKYVNNNENSTISGGIFEGKVKNSGTISGGIFLQENPSNAKSLTLTNATIDGAGNAASAYVVPGTSVSITAPQTLSNLPFIKWNVTGGTLQLANTTSVTFAMPTADTAIEAAYKENPTPTAPATASKTASTAASSGWIPSYEIQFKDCNGQVISDQWVAEGQAAVIPSGYQYGEQELNWVYRNLTVSPISCKAAGYVVPDTADKN